jgi:leucyl-tRNA synthetase
LRSEFEYWYPLDLRCSAKDLIRNHLTMSLYNHAAIWDQQPEKWTKSYYCNGYLNLNNEKMSKSTGNFLTLRNTIDKFGVDATRITLADAGDTLDDGNFDELTANAAILKLFVFEEWMTSWIKKGDDLNFSLDLENCDDLWDKIFVN